MIAAYAVNVTAHTWPPFESSFIFNILCKQENLSNSKQIMPFKYDSTKIIIDHIRNRKLLKTIQGNPVSYFYELK